MKKSKKEKMIEPGKSVSQNSEKLKRKISTTHPEEFEEDRSMDIRMKPQPLTDTKKNIPKK